MKKKTKFVEPETARGFTYRLSNGSLATDAYIDRVVNTWGAQTRSIPVRIIRERDYQRLLKAARKP